MGLDSFLYVNEIGDTAFQLSGSLCGGMFSGHGSEGSFRGKVYYDAVSELTGMSLYDDMDAGGVKKLSALLSESVSKLTADGVHDEDKLDYAYNPTFEELKTLSELFKQAAERGCVYHAWY